MDARRIRLAELLRQFQMERKLTGRKLALALDVKPDSVNQYLSGSSYPNPDSRIKIATALGLTIEELEAHLENRPVRRTRTLDQIKTDIRALPLEDFLEIYQIASERALAELRAQQPKPDAAGLHKEEQAN